LELTSKCPTAVQNQNDTAVFAQRRGCVDAGVVADATSSNPARALLHTNPGEQGLAS
jgi:hypothetical protein